MSSSHQTLNLAPTIRANQLIIRHGPQALGTALRKASECQAADDTAGAIFWREVAREATDAMRVAAIEPLPDPPTMI